MRFPRQARVFRGQLEVAPVAAVVFLLVMFLQMGSLLHLPGVLVNLENPAAVIRISRDGLIHFGANTYTEDQTNQLQAALRQSSASPPFALQVDANTPPVLASHLSRVVTDLPNVQVILDNPAATIHISRDGLILFGTNSFTESQTDLLRVALQQSPDGPPFELRVDPGTPSSVASRLSHVVADIMTVHLPASGKPLLGTDDPTVVVAVNFRGQYFYDNRIVSDKELRLELTRQLQAATARAQGLTVTIAADEQVDWPVVAALAEVAHEVGIKEVLLAERTSKSPAAGHGATQ